jgi:hypothetical protein
MQVKLVRQNKSTSGVVNDAWSDQKGKFLADALKYGIDSLEGWECVRNKHILCQCIWWD